MYSDLDLGYSNGRVFAIPYEDLVSIEHCDHARYGIPPSVGETGRRRSSRYCAVAKDPGKLEQREPMRDKEVGYACQGCHETSKQGRPMIQVRVGSHLLRFCCFVCLASWIDLIRKSQREEADRKYSVIPCSDLISMDTCDMCLDHGVRLNQRLEYAVIAKIRKSRKTTRTQK